MVARVSGQVPKFLLRLPAASAQTKHLARSPTMWSFGIRRGRYIAFTPAYSQSRVSRAMERAITTPLFLITSIQPLYFHTIVHSFAQPRATISHAFNSLRTLSIAKGSATPLALSGVGQGSTLSFRPCPLRWPLPAPNSSDPQRGRGAHIQLLLLQAQGFQVHGRSH
jgi:hypothetical protein